MMTRRARFVAVLAAVGGAAACAGDVSGTTEPVRSYTIRVEISDDTDGAYRYLALDPVDIRVGDEVTFEMTNTGRLGHDMNIFGRAGDIANAPTVTPGGTTQLTVLFDEAGPYQLRCYTDDHLTQHEMFAAFDVLEPDET